MRVVLETKRLVLRVPIRSDADALALALADPEVMRYIGDGHTRGHDEAVAWVERDRRGFDVDRFGKFAVVRREDGRTIGRVGLSAWDPATWVHATRAEIGPHAEIELGWTLLREAWGHGFATEAALCVRDWALTDVGLRRLISLIHPDNIRSQHVARRLGETHERDVVTAKGYPAQLWAVD